MLDYDSYAVFSPPPLSPLPPAKSGFQYASKDAGYYTRTLKVLPSSSMEKNIQGI